MLRLLAVLGFLLPAIASAQPVCPAGTTNQGPCYPQASSLQATDILLGTQANGPSKSNQTVKVSISQLLSGGFPAAFSTGTFSGTLGVTGAGSFSSTLDVTGAGTVGGTLGVTGAGTFSNTLALSGASSALTVGNNTATTTPLVTLNAASATTRQIRWQTAGSLRGAIGMNTTAETATVAIATNAALDPTSPAVSLTTNAATSSGNVLTFASTTGVVAGMTVVGTNITAGTKVTVVTATQVVLNADVTSTGVANGATVKFGANVLPFASTTGVTVGMYATGGLQTNTRVTAVTSTTVTISANPSATINSGTTITFHSMTGGDLTFSRFTDTGGTIDSPLSITRSRRGITTNGALNASTSINAVGAAAADNATTLWTIANVTGNYTNTGQYYINRITAFDSAYSPGASSTRSLLGVEYTAQSGSVNATWAIDSTSSTGGMTGDFINGGSYNGGALRATGKSNDNQGGTDTGSSASGSVWGANIVGALNSGATNHLAVRAVEINVGIASGASARVKQGLKITLQGSTDRTAAAYDNSFINLAAGSSSTSKMESGIEVAGIEGSWPFNNSSALINLNKWSNDTPAVGSQPIGFVVDAWGADVNDSAFRAYGSTGPFRVVGGTAAVQIGTTIMTPSSAGLAIDAKGAYATAAAVSAGGSGWTVNDIARDSNGGVYQITAAPAGVVSTVTMLRAPYLTSTSTPANPVAVTADWRPNNAGGTGLTLNLTWNTTANFLALNPSGNTRIGTGSAIATNATSGLLMLPTMAGAPTGTVGSAGNAAVVIDTTNNKICWSTGGGTWKCALGS